VMLEIYNQVVRRAFVLAHCLPILPIVLVNGVVKLSTESPSSSELPSG